MQVQREVVVPAEPDEVWHAVTDAQELGDWLGIDVDIDVCPGGRGTFAEPGAPLRLAVVDEVDEGRSWRFHWWPADGSGPLTEVTVELEPAGPDQTRVRVVETVIPGRTSIGFERRLGGLELRTRAFVRA